ncbi:MAG: kelch repeat-containing protein [Thermoanaerobaculia bacterium]
MASPARRLGRRFALIAPVLLLALSTTAYAYPTARTQTHMVYDAAEGNILLFGGVTGTDSGNKRVFLNDTWEWNGKRWIEVRPAHQPSGRSAGGMIYDSNHDDAVLFGGFDGTNYLNDTWFFVDGDWQRQSTADAPTPRRLFGMTYDPVMDRTFVFGGSNATANLYDTWTFDGTTWTRVNETGPSVNTPFLVYDAARDQVLLIGQTAEAVTQMYRWSSDHWEQLTPDTLPTCINSTSIVYEPNNQKVLMVGGFCSNAFPSSDSWEWDGTNWTKLTTSPPIGFLYGEAMAYDPNREEVIVFGGIDSLTRNETYRYRDLKFTQASDTFTPGPRSLPVMATDPESGTIWMYGGHNVRRDFFDLWRYSSGRWVRVNASNTPVCTYGAGTWDPSRKKMVLLCEDSTTYEWDGSSWKAFPDLKNLPPGRRFSSLAYDPALKKVLLFGGWETINRYLNDIWEWDGTNWTKVDRKGSAPDPRSSAAFFWDPSTQKMMVFGGIGRPTQEDSARRYGDMFSWDGSRWNEVKPSTAPSIRYAMTTGTDPLTGQPMIFGGKDQNENYLAEQWSWDGSKWLKVEPGQHPEARINSAMTIDPITGDLTLYGGYDGRYFQDTWTWDGTNWTLVPVPPGKQRGIGFP